ncbi:PE domain-containing protein, partial [Mycobacterium shinjukuense]|nr:PE domain-containing protein [Mycobacterium shinjukuense]MCV6985536.1 PE domain-containing protein [Mycobacterium shinjukuense]
MSYVLVAPQLVEEAASQLASIRWAVSAANAAAAAP